MRPRRKAQTPFHRFQPPATDGIDELVVVLLVLVGVAIGEVSDRYVECVTVTEVFGHRDAPQTGRAPGPRSSRTCGRRGRARVAAAYRPPPTPSCRAAGASRSGGAH